MVLKRNTVVLLVVAVVLGVGVYWWEQQRNAQEQSAPTATTPGTPIFDFQEDQVQAITITTSKQTLKIVRQAGQSPVWQMQAPYKGSADPAAVAYLLNLLTTGRSDRTLAVPADQRQEYGLTKPTATVEVTLSTAQKHQLVLGKFNFNQSYLYAQVNPSTAPQSTLDVLLVPTALESAVNRPLNEWQLPTQSPQPSGTPKIDAD